MSATVEILPPTISVEQAGELLGVSRRSAYRAASRGQIPTVRVGRRLLVPTRRLLDMLGMPAADETAPRVSPQVSVAELRTTHFASEDATAQTPTADPSGYARRGSA